MQVLFNSFLQIHIALVPRFSNTCAYKYIIIIIILYTYTLLYIIIIIILYIIIFIIIIIYYIYNIISLYYYFENVSNNSRLRSDNDLRNRVTKGRRGGELTGRGS